MTRSISTRAALALGMALALVATSSALGQQVTGTLGSPSATTTISGKQLPPPHPTFGGVIKDNAMQSTAWWPPRWPKAWASAPTLACPTCRVSAGGR